MTHISKKKGGANAWKKKKRLPPGVPTFSNSVLVTGWLQQALGGSYLLCTTVKLTLVKVQQLTQVITIYWQ